MAAAKVISILQYYVRQGYARHVQMLCREVLKTSPNNHLLQFWRVYGKIMEGSFSEAMQDLQSIQPSHDTAPAIAAARIMVHKAARLVDHEAVGDLTVELEGLENSCSESASILLASFYCNTGAKERARAIGERVLRTTGDRTEAEVLLGWTIVTQQNEDYGLDTGDELDDARAYFESAVETDPNNLEAAMGRAKIAEMQKQYDVAIERLQEVSHALHCLGGQTAAGN
ncbi:unnamed protein product [Ostreobium quekettii]|uniref:Tetratricopeptide repeat protein 21A/21B N-terminal ARM repeat domain-containing protein n=1 Tax=Ostreobium quekettii TaxID=121088 RepID=A0A8S1JIV2_9CHLO|nr:unnamed protein product [Ostreobium quekettii]